MLVPANVLGDGTDIRLKAGRTASKSCRARPDRCARIIYPYVYALAALLLFQDFYNWGEAVSRINALTEGRIGQLFNGIVITCSLGRGIIFALSHSFPSFIFPRPRISYFCRPTLLLFYNASFFASSAFCLVVLFSSVDRRVAFSRSLLSSAIPDVILFLLFFLAVSLPLIFRHCCLLIVLH